MRNKINKKTTGRQGLADPAIQLQIEADFAKVQASIKEKMDRVKMFEDLISKKVTVGYCPGCEHFNDCPCMRHGQRFDKLFCILSHREAQALFSTFAKGLSIVEAVTPEASNFSIN